MERYYLKKGTAYVSKIKGKHIIYKSNRNLAIIFTLRSAIIASAKLNGCFIIENENGKEVELWQLEN